MAQGLTQTFVEADARIRQLETRAMGRDAPDLGQTLDETLDIVRRMLRAYRRARLESKANDPTHRIAGAAESDDVLEVFKAFVKGEPSLNAVRDNIRELVYYQNCLQAHRQDALPAQPARMAIRTTRHIYLYLHSRAEQEQRLH